MATVTNVFSSVTQVLTSASTIGHYLHLASGGELFLDAQYQREYVWGKEQQQALMQSIFNGVPLGGIAVVINPDSVEQYCEVVDGKQRLTTILKFVNNEFAYIGPQGKSAYFRDLDFTSQRLFKTVHLPEHQLLRKDGGEVSLAQKLEYFMRINFGGIPQDELHRQKVIKMLEAEA
jgi:hypothetical protein